MCRSSLAAFMLLVSFSATASAGTPFSDRAYVFYNKGDYRISSPATVNRPRAKLPRAEGEALVERLLDPTHMVLTGLGEEGAGVLHIGDGHREVLFTLLGRGRNLTEWSRCERVYGYATGRPEDSTVVLVRLGDACLDNPNYVEAIAVYAEPRALPKAYRIRPKLFTQTNGVHSGLATESGLRLGLTRKEVEGLLGKPIWKGKDTYAYGVVADILLSAELLRTRWNWPWDVKPKPGAVQHFIDVWFVGDRVSAFLLRKMYDM